MTRRWLTTLIGNRRRAGLLAASGILFIAFVDFVSGVELRVFPLYYAPIALAAWSLGREAAVTAAGASALCWLLANQLAGQQYSHLVIWWVNTLVQGVSFATIGILVSVLREALTRERSLSRTDALSGLMNHRAFYEASNRLLGLCRRTSRPVTLAYLDLDDFKRINDTQGHLSGDDILRSVGRVLLETVRASDAAARLGGDEFAVLLPDLGAIEAGHAVHRLHQAINAVTVGTHHVTVSIGAVTMLSAPEEVDTMVHAADAVLYRAKADGKNQVRFSTADPEPAPT